MTETAIRKHPTWAEREQRARDRVKPEPVDFSHVPPSQWAMHDRLENWANAGRGGDKQSGKAAPMFLLYRSTEAKRPYGEATARPVDRADAALIAKGVIALPEKHRDAINWHYLHPRNPTAMARRLAVSLKGLAELVHAGRQMLINRNI